MNGETMSMSVENKNYRILVIDDSNENRDAVAMLLTYAGYSVARCDSCVDARALLTSFVPQILLIDVCMPGINGLDFIASLDRSQRKKFEVIVMTGYENLVDARRTMELGIQSYLGKPIHTDILLRKVAVAIDTIERRATQHAHWAGIANQLDMQGQQTVELSRLLDEKERMMDNILSNTTEGILALDPDGSVVYMNRKAQEMTGISFSEAIGQHASNILAPCGINLAPLANETPTVREATIVRSGHPPMHCEARYSPFLNSEGAINGTIIDLTDQTSRIETERVRTFFLSGVAHELRTPVNILMNYVSLLRAPLAANSSASDMLDDIHVISLRLKELATNLVNIASLAAPNDAITHDEIALPTFMQELINQFSHEAHARNITMRIETPLTLRIIANRQLLGIALSALISNAVKFNTEGGVVIIHYCVEQNSPTDAISFSIRDNGPGISEKARSILFQSFAQGEDPLTRTHRGLGLGLYLVSKIVQALNGTIAVDSNPETGSAFTLTIPCLFNEK